MSMVMMLCYLSTKLVGWLTHTPLGLLGHGFELVNLLVVLDLLYKGLLLDTVRASEDAQHISQPLELL
jgi:hypothetical protein